MQTQERWLNLIRESAYPVSKIASKIEPYLRVLVDEFHPEQLVLFGSYAYGNPDQDSDVDLLIVKPIARSSVKEVLAIHQRWREIVGRQVLPIDLLIESPESHLLRLQSRGAFYHEINQRGLQLL